MAWNIINFIYIFRHYKWLGWEIRGYIFMSIILNAKLD